jgi:hypothetical protein
MKYFANRFGLFLLLFTLAVPLWSQSLISGDLAGTVYDTSGAVVPNVSLVLKNTDSGESFTSTSNSAGAYRFALLKPGHYELTATAPDFNTQLQKTIVQVGQQTTLNINLAVRNSNTTVEVNAQAESLLQTDHADISTAFD